MENDKQETEIIGAAWDELDLPAREIAYPSMILDMPACEYHKRDEEISKHGLDLVAQSPARYKYSRDNPGEPTAAMRFGTLLHTAILEPELFEDSVAFVPEDAPNKPPEKYRTAKKPSPETLAAFTWWDNFLARIAGKEIVTFDELQQIRAMRDAVHSHPAAAKLLGLPGHIEPSLFWKDETTGQAMRMRADKILTEHRIIIDLKSCEDAGEEAFSKACAKFKYDVQSAVYPEGAKAVIGGDDWKFVFIAVEKKAPHLVAVYEADEVMRFTGTGKAQAWLATYAECQNSGEWPGYSSSIQKISLPAWALK